MIIDPFKLYRQKKTGIYTALDSYIKVFDELGYKGVVVDEDLINTRLLKKYDVIQVNGPVGFRTLFKIWRSKVTAFLTLHGWVIQEPFNQLKIKKDLKSTLYFVYKVIYNLLNWIFHLILFIPLIYNNRVTAVSKITSKKNRVNAFVIPNALITDEIEGKVRECPELHWDCITAVTYISGGGSKVLSIQRLAEIISEVNRKAGCRIRLLVFGESPEIEDDCIEFMGYRDDFLCHVRSADIMLLGYDMSELGYAVLEAGYLGVPVAKFRGEFEELQDEVHGIIAEDDSEMIEKLIRFIENPNLKDKWGKNIKRHIIMTRSPDVISDHWKRFFDDITKLN